MKTRFNGDLCLFDECTGIPVTLFSVTFFTFGGETTTPFFSVTFLVSKKTKKKALSSCDIWKMEDILLFLLLTRESPFSLSSRDLV